MPAVQAKAKGAFNTSGQAVSLFMVYQFLKRLVTPFTQWPAYIEGIIDEKGNIVKKANDRHTLDEKRALTKFDLLVLRIKRLLEKVPGGKSKLVSYAAALYLIKEEWKDKNIEEIENDQFVEEIYDDIMALLEQVEEDIANTAGSGDIAGFGVRGADDVKVTKKKAKKYQEKNKQEAPKLRTTLGTTF